jgi:hypothetical protein
LSIPWPIQLTAPTKFLLARKELRIWQALILPPKTAVPTEMSLALSTTWMLTSIEMLHQLVARLLIPLWHFLQQLSALTMPTTLVTLLGTSRLGRTNSQGWCRPVITSRRNRRNNPLRSQG